MEDYMRQVDDAVQAIDLEQVGRAVEGLRKAREKFASVWIVGNGGSATTASHFANDLVKMAGVRAFSVPDIYAATLAYGNDEGWESMFEGTVNSLMLRDDVLVAISCSGESMNVIRTCLLFDEEHLIILTGNRTRSKLASIHEGATRIFVPHEDIRVQENVHLAVCHMIAGELAKNGAK
jgi:D-sedoheptulose 7-phosphate isomerase